MGDGSPRFNYIVHASWIVLQQVGYSHGDGSQGKL